MKKRKVIVFSGAGISAESGLGTFRDEAGLWEQYNIEEVATPEAWKVNPENVTNFYNKRRKQCYDAQPNPAHCAIAKLEKKFDVEVITQNVDNLHERAGSTMVTHLHGDISKVKSSGPNAEKKYYPQKSWAVKMGDLCPDGYQLRPHVVWFGEAVPLIEKASQKIQSADIVIVVGTSLNVYPAAGIIDYAPDTAQFYLVDPNEIHVPQNYFVYKESASTGIPKLIDQLMKYDK